MMRRFTVIFLLLAAGSQALAASDFDWLVREFSRESGARQVRVPFLGFARFVVAVGHPAGATDMRLALFERGDVGSLRFSELTDSTVGPSWSPMIRVRSKRGESTNIYARQDGKQLRLLITTLDDEDATFVEVKLKPQALMRFIDDHRSGREH